MSVTVCLCLAYVYMCVQLHAPVYAFRDWKSVPSSVTHQLCIPLRQGSLNLELVFSQLGWKTAHPRDLPSPPTAELGSGTIRTLWVLESGLWSSCAGRKYS